MVPLLVEAFGESVLDATPSQVTAVLAGRVRLVRQETIRAGAGPADAGAGHADLLQRMWELGAVAIVARGQDEDEGLVSPLGSEVDFGGEPSSGASHSPI